jgi:hypothetical protein
VPDDRELMMVLVITSCADLIADETSATISDLRVEISEDLIARPSPASDGRELMMVLVITSCAANISDFIALAMTLCTTSISDFIALVITLCAASISDLRAAYDDSI